MPTPKGEEPFLLIEFQSDNRRSFQSRIEVYGFLEGDGVRYRYTDKNRERNAMKDWTVRVDDYVILNFIPPHRSLVDSEINARGLIQLGKRHGRR